MRVSIACLWLLALLGCTDGTRPLPRPEGGALDAAVMDAAPVVDAGFEADAAVPEICGGVVCAAGERCNVWTRQCQSLAIPYPPPGSDNGGPCTTESECRSNGSGMPARPVCVTSNGADFCVSFCALPSDVGVPDRFERSDCPEGSLCFASSQFGDDEGIGTCVQGCTEDAECRTADGYYCRRSIGGRTYDNGYCAPAHCMSRGCTGFVCGC